MKTVSKNEMKELLKDLLTYGCSANCEDNCSQHRYGKFFHVQFIKKDGTERQMTCRMGVKKDQTGKGLAFDAIAKGLLPVFDLEKDDYRFVNMETLRKAKIQGEEYAISD